LQFAVQQIPLWWNLFASPKPLNWQGFIKNNLVFECHRNVGALRGVDEHFNLQKTTN